MKRGMNKILVSWICFGFLIVLSGGVSAQEVTVCPSSMVSYWKFDEGSGTIASDSVGTNDGTLINGPVWTSGKVGGALSFDGVDDYADISTVIANGYPRQANTIEMWISPKQTFDASTGAETFYSQWHRHLIGYSNGTLRARTAADPNWNTPVPVSDHMLTYATTLEAGKWYHVALTFEAGGSIVLYLNGIEVASDSEPDALNLIGGYGTAASIGRMYDGGQSDHYAYVRIDEVAIYNRALPAEEIQQHYQNSLAEKAYCSPPPTLEELEERIAALEEKTGGLESTINKIIEKINWLIDYVIPKRMIKRAEKKGHPEPYPELSSEG